MAAPKGNKYALGCTTSGAPPEYPSRKEYEKKIKEYFDYCIENNEKATITGIALYLGFESRQSFYDYEQRKEFSYTTKRARLAVENAYETRGQAIDIFGLKNLGWKDTSQIDHTNAGNPFSNLSDDELINRINKLLASGKKE